MLVKDLEHKRQTSVRERIKCPAKKLLTTQLTTLTTTGSYRIYYFSVYEESNQMQLLECMYACNLPP